MDAQVSNERFLDWPRIRHLMKLGIFAALMVLAGDMLLGWGVHDVGKPGLEGFLSAYLHLPDGRIFWSAFLGLIGIPLEALCYFSVYRLIKPYSEKYAHLYRSGILGVLAFAGCGVHVPCLACVFFYKYMMAASPDTALDASVRFGLYFLLPGMILFFVFWIAHHIAHIGAFAKGMTPYPKWCWIFCPAVGMALTMLLKFLPETALRNAVTAAWISIGNMWMFIGLLIMSKKAEAKA
ncbi:MAG: hypothetical protein IJI53_11100 [Clostridia bacterium]|nr:hypothetical protein [Clostridia bacterium]